MTTNLQDIFKSMQKQNQTVQSAFGLNSLQAIAVALQNQNKTQLNLSGLSGLKRILLKQFLNKLNLSMMLQFF